MFLPLLALTHIIAHGRLGLHRVPSLEQMRELVQAGVVEVEDLVLGVGAGDDQLATGVFRVRVEHPHRAHFACSASIIMQS